MSLHFDAQQFDLPYSPRRLRNWEIPNKFPHKRPTARIGRTQIIANNRGHLLPGVPRPQALGTGPWGHFIPTWQMPKKITREIAEGLRNPKPKTNYKVTTDEKPTLTKKEEAKVVDPYYVEGDPCKDLPDKTQEIKTVCPIHGV